MATATATPKGEVILIPLGQIEPSSSNPRRSIDAASLKELAASIAELGVQQPIIVRPKPGRFAGENTAFQVVAGERRWRASKIAKKDSVPSIVRELTDEQVREVQIVENLQRADIHPMEEAEAYKALHPTADADHEDLPLLVARRVGKSIDYVTKRLRLLSLIEEAKEAFLERDLSLDHALLIAALQPAEQERALHFVFNPRGYEKEKTIHALRKKLRDPGKHESYVGRECSTVRELRHWIETEVALELSKAEWDLEDRHLVPEAGACTTCPKRTGSNEALFGGLIDVKAETCMDASCFKQKRAALVRITAVAIAETGKEVVRLSHRSSSAKPAADKRKDEAEPDARVFKVGQFVEAKKGECDHVIVGVFSDAPEDNYGPFSKVQAGAKRSVCVEPGCKKHRKSYEKPRGSSNTRSAPAINWEERRKLAEAASAAERVLRVKIVKAVVDSVNAWSPTMHRLMLELLMENRAHSAHRGLSTAVEPELKTPDKATAYVVKLKPESKELAKALAAIALAAHIDVYLHEPGDLARDRRDMLKDAERIGRADLVKKLIKAHDEDAKVEAKAKTKQEAKKKSAAA